MNSPISRYTIGLLVCVLTLLSACDQSSIISDYSDIKNHSWSYDDKKSFDFTIADTSKYYDIYVNLRHTGDYPYSNIWMFVYTKFPYDSTSQSRVQLPLADKSGKWYTEGSGDILDHRVLIQEKAQFPDLGSYQITLEQNMRLNPLPHIVAVGLTVYEHSSVQ